MRSDPAESEVAHVEVGGAEPERVDLRSAGPVGPLREALQTLAPGVLADGVLDAARLAELLQVPLAQPPTGQERFGLQWAGRVDAVRSLLTPDIGALVPDLDASIGFDTARDVLIRGDNLAVLKLLQKAYNRKIKLIYIDPPYNTGRQFVYSDDFRDGLQAYLAYSGQLDATGNRPASGIEQTGRLHSRWLSMMYPRLSLARNLLTVDGALVVSIDTGEFPALRMVLDEIFGAENHVADLVWQKKYTRSNDARFFSDNHEYLVVYARSLDDLAMSGEPRSQQQDAAYRNPDDDPNGRWKATPLHAKSGRPGQFTHTFANGREWSPPVGTYPRFTAKRLVELEASGAIWFGANGQAQPSRKTYLKDLSDRLTPTTLWLYGEVGSTHEANNELKALGLGGAFDNPKPTRLIRRLVQLFTASDDLVLDFFAGSGTTAHAVWLQNAADGGTRRSILVDLPEPVPAGSTAERLGFATVADVTVARLRAVLDGGQAGHGLRVLNLSASSFTSTGATPGECLLHPSTPAGEQRDWHGLAMEVLLAEGVGPDEPWAHHDVAGVPAVSAGGVGVVLTDWVPLDVARAAVELPLRVVIFLEDGSATEDALKVTTVAKAHSRGIAVKRIRHA